MMTMKDLISYPDFEKMDIRVGEVVAAEVPEWSNKLLKLEVDLGEEIGRRVLFSGISKWYQPEDVLGKKMMVLVNMEPKKMGEEESQGMLLMVDGEERPELIFLDERLASGLVVR